MDFIKGVSGVSPILEKQLANRQINVDSLQKAVPKMDLLLTMGSKNVAAQYLADASEISFSDLMMSLHNDSLISLGVRSRGLNISSTRLDTGFLPPEQH